MCAEQINEFMNLVFVGHVDHGKSTIVGRLLADTDSLPEGKLQQVKDNCAKNSKPFEYAFLIDALKDEQTQGITIDSARVFFQTQQRHYIIIDAPGHIEFLKNMITGASRAEAALLVIDAEEGIQENSRRHGYMLAMLGIKQVAVLVNKMDLVAYRQDTFHEITKEYTHFLKEIGCEAVSFIPVSGREGDMVAGRGNQLDWYKGPTVLELLDNFSQEKKQENQPFRLPVQDIYKFTKFNDTRRIVAGTIVSGSIQVGDDITFFPSGKKSQVRSIETFNTNPVTQMSAGYATALTLSEQIYVKRGELAFRSNQKHPEATTRLQASLFWLSKEPMSKDKEYFLKLGTAKTPMRLEHIERIINASDLKSTKDTPHVQRHEVAECILKLNRALSFDCVDKISETSRFVIVDNYNIVGGGIIRKALEDKYEWIRDNVMARNYKWIKSHISLEERSEKYNQRSRLIIITGEKDAPRKEIARRLEEQLFHEGKIVYFLGIGSLIYGVDADIKNKKNTHTEHWRRLTEVANILLDTGVILILTAIELTQDDIEMLKSTIDLNAEQLKTVWIGDEVSTDMECSCQIRSQESVVNAVKIIRESSKTFN